MADTLPPVVALLELDAAGFQRSLGELRTSIEDTKAQLDAQGAEMGAAFDPLSAGAEGAAAGVTAAFDGLRADLATASDGLAGTFDAGFEGITGAADGSAAAAAKSWDEAMADIRAQMDELDQAAALSADLMAKDMEDSAARQAEAMKGVKDAGVEAGASLGESGALGAAGLRDAEEGAEGDADSFSERVANTFKKIGSSLGGLGVPFAETFTGMGEKIEGAEAKGDGFKQSLLSLAHVATAVTGVALAGVAAESIHLASEQQEAATSLAASADISAKAAQGIGSAFEDTAFKSIFTGTEMTQAYSQVAAQLATVQGHALSSAQATQVMAAAGDLAEASGTNLATSTSSLASVMQAYGIDAAGAGAASDALFNAARLTGNPLSTVATQVQKLHTQLGAATPSLSDVGGLLVDLAEHGATGRAAISAVSSSLTTLLKVSPEVQATQTQLKQAFDTLPPSLQGIAKGLETGTMSSNDYSNALKTLSPSQASAIGDFEKLVVSANKTNASMGGLKLTSAQQELKSLGINVFTAGGKFEGMQTLLTQLTPKLAGMDTASKEAALTQLFGASAAQKMLDVVNAGPGAYDKATAAVSKSGAAHAAAEKQAQTLQHQLELLKAGLEDEGVKIGSFLIPKLDDLVHVVGDVIDWFEKHKTAAEVLAGVIGGALAVAVGVTLVNMLSSMVESTVKAGESVAGLGRKLLGLGDDSDESSEATTEAIDGMTASFQQLSMQTQTSIDELNLTLGQLPASADEAAAGISGSFGEVDATFAAAAASARASMEAIDTAMEGVETAGADLAAVAPEDGMAISEMFGPIGLAIGAIMLAMTLLRGHWKEIFDAIKDVTRDAVGFVVDAWDDLKKAVTHGIDDVIDFAKAHWPLIVGILLGPVGFVVAEIVKHWTAIKDDAEKAWDDIVGALSAAWRAIVRVVSDGVSDAVRFFEQLPDRSINAVVSLNERIIEFGLHVMESLARSIENGAVAVWNFFDSMPDRILKGLAGIGRDMLHVGEDIVHGIISGIESAPGAILHAIEHLIPGGGIVGKAAHILGLAEGGIVTKPTLAMVGEAGYPEAVIPLKHGETAEGMARSLAELGGASVGTASAQINIAAAPASYGSSSGGGTLELHMNINGRTFYQATISDLKTALLQNKRQVVALGLG